MGAGGSTLGGGRFVPPRSSAQTSRFSSLSLWEGAGEKELGTARLVDEFFSLTKPSPSPRVEREPTLNSFCGRTYRSQLRLPERCLSLRTAPNFLHSTATCRSPGSQESA